MSLGTTIGKEMYHGFAGSFSRQPDMVIDTHPLGGDANVPFGAALVYDTDGSVLPFGASNTADDFVGVAGKYIKSSVDYMNQNEGICTPNDAVSVFKRGCINVICQNGTPAVAGNVYVRTALNEAYPDAVVGGFEAEEDTGKTILLDNVQWRGAADTNGVVEIRILTINKA